MRKLRIITVHIQSFFFFQYDRNWSKLNSRQSGKGGKEPLRKTRLHIKQRGENVKDLMEYSWANDSYGNIIIWADDSYGNIIIWADDSYGNIIIWADDSYGNIINWADDSYSNIII